MKSLNECIELTRLHNNEIKLFSQLFISETGYILYRESISFWINSTPSLIRSITHHRFVYVAGSIEAISTKANCIKVLRVKSIDLLFLRKKISKISITQNKWTTLTSLDNTFKIFPSSASPVSARFIFGDLSNGLCICEYFNNSGKHMRYFPIRMQNKQIYYSLSINSAWNLRLLPHAVR